MDKQPGWTRYDVIMEQVPGCRKAAFLYSMFLLPQSVNKGGSVRRQLGCYFTDRDITPLEFGSADTQHILETTS